MHLSGKHYVPTLSLRPSEMNALEYLPDAAKQHMTPVILLAPWLNSKTLNQAVERVQRAFPGRPFILDIDRNYQISVNSTINQAKEEWQKLSDANGDCAEWYEFCDNFANITPCLRVKGDISQQLKNFQDTGREFSVRLTKDIYQSSDMMRVLFSCLKVVYTPYSVIIDSEWTDDALSLAGQHERLITNYLKNLGENVSIVSSCTSMIKDFKDILGVKNIPFSNHNLVEQLARNTNCKIIYGDWGSTRPRDPKSSFASTPIPRIDYPTSNNSWLISRPEDRLYQDAARHIVEHQNWDSDLDIWGVKLIKATAQGEKGIDNPRANTAARINIHLYRQSMVDNQSNSPITDDAPWMD